MLPSEVITDSAEEMLAAMVRHSRSLAFKRAVEDMVIDIQLNRNTTMSIIVDTIIIHFSRMPPLRKSFFKVSYFSIISNESGSIDLVKLASFLKHEIDLQNHRRKEVLMLFQLLDLDLRNCYL